MKASSILLSITALAAVANAQSGRIIGFMGGTGIPASSSISREDICNPPTVVCNNALPAPDDPVGGGAAYDPRDRSVWHTQGTRILQIDIDNCAVGCAMGAEARARSDLARRWAGLRSASSDALSGRIDARRRRADFVHAVAARAVPDRDADVSLPAADSGAPRWGDCVRSGAGLALRRDVDVHPGQPAEPGPGAPAFEPLPADVHVRCRLHGTDDRIVFGACDGVRRVPRRADRLGRAVVVGPLDPVGFDAVPDGAGADVLPGRLAAGRAVGRFRRRAAAFA